MKFAITDHQMANAENPNTFIKETIEEKLSLFGFFNVINGFVEYQYSFVKAQREFTVGFGSYAWTGRYFDE